MGRFAGEIDTRAPQHRSEALSHRRQRIHRISAAQPDYHVFPEAQFIRQVTLWSGSRRFSISLARTIGVSLSMPSERFIYPGYEPLPDLAVYLDHNDAQGTFRSCSTAEKNDGWVRIRLAPATAPYDCAQAK